MRPLILPIIVLVLAISLMATATASRQIAAEVEAATSVPPPYLAGGHYIPPQP